MILSDIGGYYNAMDREYNSSVAKRESPLGEVRIRDIGISTAPFNDQVSALQARIFQGASTVELGFTGAGKGNMGQHATTPEMYGREEREAIRDMAKINRVNLSTHATVGIGPLSGMGQQGFSEDQREKTLREIERAIDFAADTAQGGAVVVHTGEFPRPLSENYKEFELFPREKDEAAFYVVDPQTGQIVSGIKKDQLMVLPVWERDENNHIIKDIDGNPKPRFNREKGEFLTKEVGWDAIKELKDWFNKENNKQYTEAQVFNIISTKARANYQMGFAKNYEEHYQSALQQQDQIQGVQEDVRRTNKFNPRYDRLLAGMLHVSPDQISGLPETQKIEMFNELSKSELENLKSTLKNYGDSAVASKQQAQEEIYRAERAETIDTFAMRKTADTIARAAEFAMKKTEMLKAKGQLQSPIYVSPENIFPETFGAHPSELKEIIVESRKKFVKDNEETYGKAKASELAEQHIKATFDIGHAYTWRKYFKEDKKKSFEENDQDFKEWMFKEIDKLNKDHIIGHVHISDNFGYEDEHVTPGQGRVPIREFIDKMKKAGIKNVITEPAHQDYKAMLGSWKEFGGPMYGGEGAPGRRWTEVEHSYFGQTRSPYFIFGDYAPNQQEFTLWSQTPLE
jgi:sugar phosphate isomerase/epimerase